MYNNIPRIILFHLHVVHDIFLANMSDRQCTNNYWPCKSLLAILYIIMDRYLKAIVSIVLLQILEDGLNRSEVQNSFQTNVTTGVILSVPSLLFPSSSSPSPDSRLVKEVTIALASRLAQVPHQEAVLKSLMKIRDAIGVEEFESYLEDYDNKLKKNIEILSKIYNVKSNKKNLKKGTDGKNVEKV